MLRAERLSFTYGRDRRKVLDEWSADFPAGSATALTGRSGQGKSTLLALLGLMLRPDGGDVVVDGESTSGWDDRARARSRSEHFGFVFQDAALDPTRSVIDNVTEVALYRGLAREVARRRGRELLDRFDVDVPPERKPGQVSGGQAQRIALCRALVTRPRFVLADEPTGNLDPATATVVLDALRAHAAAGGTVVLVTHSPEAAAACERSVQL